MKTIQTIGLVALGCTVLSVGVALATGNQDAQKTMLRLVILTESNGSHPAASLKQIDQQMARLRADGTIHGLEFEMKATTFVADSARRHVDGTALARNDGTSEPNFALSKYETVIYVTDLGRNASTTPFVLLGTANASVLPGIVIDSTEFGGQACGRGKDKPCRALTLAVAEALIARPAAPTHEAAKAMKERVLQAGNE